ncbi:hypothetical protein ACVGWD_05075, partial [Enterobacter asburiae]
MGAEETTKGDTYKTGRKKVINESVRQSGTDITAGGNVTVIAGRDVTCLFTHLRAHETLTRISYA